MKANILLCQDDLGHVAEWIKRTQDSDTNEFAVFLDTMCVVVPMLALERTGAIFIDPCGTEDTTNMLRVERAKSALMDADVIIHLTGVRHVNACEGDQGCLQSFWKVRLFSLWVSL